MNDLEQHALSETEQALVDALKTDIEATCALNSTARAAFAESFRQQRDGNIAKKQPKAAAVFEMLRVYCADARPNERERAQQLLQERPKGRA